jgi:ABC-type transporter MlaC component
MRKPIVSKTPVWKVMALGAGIGLAMLSYPVHAAPVSGGDTVQGLYEALLSTMKNGRTLGQSGRFTQLEPVIRRTFDIPLMARLSVGPSWATLTGAQRQQVMESFGRYISAIYADRFDSYAGRLCHGNEGGTHREPKLAKHHAAVTALFHCAAASVRNFRSVARETRWR